MVRLTHEESKANKERMDRRKKEYERDLRDYKTDLREKLRGKPGAEIGNICTLEREILDNELKTRKIDFDEYQDRYSIVSQIEHESIASEPFKIRYCADLARCLYDLYENDVDIHNRFTDEKELFEYAAKAFPDFKLKNISNKYGEAKYEENIYSDTVIKSIPEVKKILLKK